MYICVFNFFGFNAIAKPSSTKSQKNERPPENSQEISGLCEFF